MKKQQPTKRYFIVYTNLSFVRTYEIYKVIDAISPDAIIKNTFFTPEIIQIDIYEYHGKQYYTPKIINEFNVLKDIGELFPTFQYKKQWQENETTQVPFQRG